MAFIQGDADDNELNGTPDDDVIYGEGGSDVMYGLCRCLLWWSWLRHLRCYQPVAKVADPAWSRLDLIPYTEGPWRWARDLQRGRGRRCG